MSRRYHRPRKLSDKQAQALLLRRDGRSYRQIARELGYSSTSGAWKAVNEALLATIQEPADEVRQLEVLRLDEMFAAAWQQAMNGKLLAIDRVLRIMERRATLLGLDAPRRTELLVVTEDVIDREIRRLEAQLAENDGQEETWAEGQ